MGPKKDMHTEVLEERMELLQSEVRKELDGFKIEFQHLPKELKSMKAEVLRLPAMEKKMDFLVAHLAQLLQASGKPIVGSPAMDADRQRRTVEEQGSPGDQNFTPAPSIIGEHSSHQSDQQRPNTEPLLAGQNGGLDYRPPRMELPLFSGENPDSWVYRTERYFLLMHLTEPQMLETAIIGLDGDALTWFQ